MIPAAAVLLLLATCALPAAELSVWAVDDMVRINPETGRAFEDNPKQLPGGIRGDYRVKNAIWTAADRTVRLAAARNEVVAFQVVVEGKARRVTVAASPLRGPGGAAIDERHFQLFREWYVWIDGKRGNEPVKACMAPLGEGWYPDAAIPLAEPKYGDGFSIPSRDFHTPDSKRFPEQKNQAIWVDLHVPAEAKPGRYQGAIKVTADGVSSAVKVALDVWDFALPATMNMHAELMNYGQTVREPDPEVMYRYFRLAHEHRTFISDDNARPRFDGSDYDWTEFDRRLAPLFTGEALTDGPCARTPIPVWTFPVNYQVARPDKVNKRTGPDWPVAVPKTEGNLGVVFSEETKQRLSRAMVAWETHFVKRGWTRTRQAIFQNSLDEPGLHKEGRELEAGRQQGVAIRETAKLVKDNGLKLTFYKLDIGGGNSRNRLDLDGNGRAEGPRDVANYLGRITGMFSIHGLCLDMDALDPYVKRGDTEVIFYNGFHPRVGPNTIHGELAGFRTWAVSAWRSGLKGWADWQFRRDTGKRMFFEPNDDMGWTFYVYRGDEIGLEGKVFASLRMKSMRRGAQDFEMLRLLALKDGNERRAQQIATRVSGAGFRDVKIYVPSFQDDQTGVNKPYEGVGGNVHWSHDPAAWAAFHRALGDAIAGR